MDFVPILAMLALIKKVIDFFKYATNRDINGVVTTLSAWAAGVVVVLMFAQANFAEGVTIGDNNLSDLNFVALLILGLSVSSGAGVVNDWLSAKRPSDDPARLKLMPNAKPPIT